MWTYGVVVSELEPAQHRLLPLPWSRTYEGLDSVSAGCCSIRTIVEMSMIQKHCYECGTALTERELEGEGIVPYCPQCQQYRFPMYNVAVSMVVIDEQTGQILLIRQYGKPHFILVAGYVNRGEQLEHAGATLRHSLLMPASSIQTRKSILISGSALTMHARISRRIVWQQHFLMPILIMKQNNLSPDLQLQVRAYPIF